MREEGMLMIETNEIFIWYQNTYNPRVKVMVNSTDVTSDIIDASFRRVATNGIGNFVCKLNNTGGKYSNLWTGGEEIIFYGDNIVTPVTVRFRGILDFPKNNLSGSQMLELEGRHISSQRLEKSITASFEDKTGDYILKYIVDNFLPGFTYNNVETFSALITISWSERSAWDCIMDLLKICNADGFVDDDLDFHMFEKDSLMLETEAVVEGAMSITVNNLGSDNYFAKTKIRVVGDDGFGIPILSTTSNTSDIEREYFIRDANIETMEAASAKSTYLLQESTTVVPQFRTKSYMLFGLMPGYNIWVSVPREQLHGIYKVLEYTHRLQRFTGVTTECQFEKEFYGIEQMIKERFKKDSEQLNVFNPNRMEQSYNLTFEDANKIDSIDNLELINNNLFLATGNNQGTMVTKVYTFPLSNISFMELRVTGINLEASTFEISINGNPKNPLIPDTMVENTTEGNQIQLTVTLNATDTNPSPTIYSLGLLVK